MNDLIPTLLVVAIVSSMTLFMTVAVRSRREWDRLRLDRLGIAEEESPVLDDHGLFHRLDRGFAAMVTRSGLQIGPSQAAAIVLAAAMAGGAGLASAGGLFWLAAPGVVVGASAPLAALVVLQGRWRQQLQEQMPDVLSLIARSLRAGMSLEQAIALCGRYGPKPLADEFRRLAERIDLGLPTRLALGSMATRLKLADLDVLLSVLALQGSVGGNLPMLLDRVAAGARDRNQFRGYVRSATAMSRTSGAFVAAGQPVLLLLYMVWQPEFFAKFFETPAGLYALALSFALEIVGVVWIALLLRIDY